MPFFRFASENTSVLELKIVTHLKILQVEIIISTLNACWSSMKGLLIYMMQYIFTFIFWAIFIQNLTIIINLNSSCIQIWPKIKNESITKKYLYTKAIHLRSTCIV